MAIAYFDVGTTNTRAYILEAEGAPLGSAQLKVGGRDSAIGGRAVMLDGMIRTYREALEKANKTDADVTALYASGVVTTPYGVREVPHIPLTAGEREIAAAIVEHDEDERFHRTIHLIPGVKQVDDDLRWTNNLRGEEIEALGMLDLLETEFPNEVCALVFPGSHTQVIFARDGVFLGVLSMFTGELFDAISTRTVLAPTLRQKPGALDEDFLRKGMRDVRELGVNRAMYICHAMRVFDKYEQDQRLSYAEGVLLGDMAQGMRAHLDRFFPTCKTALIATGGYLGEVHRAALAEVQNLNDIRLCPPEEEEPWSLKGFRRLVTL